MDSADVEVWNHRFAQVAEAMGGALKRAAFSANIKERQDYSCALFDQSGNLVAQAAHIPVHLGSTATAVRAVLAELQLLPEQVALVNDPFAGGTHLPDVTMVAPVHTESGELLGYLGSRAHHSDVGGKSPGSMPVGQRAMSDDELPEVEAIPPAMGPRYAQPPEHPLRTSPVTIDDEGVRVRPTLLSAELIERFSSATRNPAERKADLKAQQASIEVGRRGLLELAARYGSDRIATAARSLSAYAEKLMRARISQIPDGIYAFADSLDDDGAGSGEVAIRVMIQISGDRAIVDFSDSDEEVPGPVNAVYAVTLSAVLYAFRLLLTEDAPTNEGLLRSIELIAPEGSILNARPPRAVSAGNVETSQRIVDVVLGALSQACPEIPAASAGSMSNLLLGFKEVTYYETIAGGAGGSAAGRGASAIQTHMTNTLNTPIESLERILPIRVTRYAVRRGSGGGGVRGGGDGVLREFEFLADAEVTLVADRRRRPPYGLQGGGLGQTGEDRLTRGDRTVTLPGKIAFRARTGDRLSIATPGGGGFGDEIKKRFWAAVLSGEPLKLPGTDEG